jgi:hypothetical protein
VFDQPLTRVRADMLGSADSADLVRPTCPGLAMYYRPLVDWARRDAPVIATLTTLGAAKSRWGFWKCCDRLQLDGHPWNRQTVLARVLPAAAEPVTTHQEAAHGSVPSAACGGAVAQCGVGRGVYERHALRRPTVSHLEYFR